MGKKNIDPLSSSKENILLVISLVNSALEAVQVDAEKNILRVSPSVLRPP